MVVKIAVGSGSGVIVGIPVNVEPTLVSVANETPGAGEEAKPGGKEVVVRSVEVVATAAIGKGSSNTALVTPTLKYEEETMITSVGVVTAASFENNDICLS